ncbi:MAG: hypothetical protein AVDCRST_MAG93-6635 [uncultured Chloroflexia bacterium]|uniref:Uncharacterized protein n=1 Tax=uncultured Chloroflexia bacterium TaxID=1672391 RepID=A0A6J4LSI1_9CHLR|nr:MAG: hypothetical protein AVDCRST_MAG93-6635 [uncultured Chloroflexia bacterium]
MTIKGTHWYSVDDGSSTVVSRTRMSSENAAMLALDNRW